MQLASHHWLHVDAGFGQAGLAFVCTKSYDTHSAAPMIRQYLAPGGYVVSLQNCMNEATIAEVVGRGKTMGCIASNIGVGGERWSKLVANTLANGVSVCTGLPGAQIAQNEAIRHFQARLGSEAIRIGEARGYRLEEIDHLPPETIARAGEGDAAALKTYDERRLSRVGRGSLDQRPSMGQDMMKGRRTEIEYLNGFVVREGEQVGIPARANGRLVVIVKRVERGELKQDPRHITELRLN